MKNLKYFWMVLCVAAGFMACSDEETGLAPVFNNSDVTLEMRRDTAEVYQISLPGIYGKYRIDDGIEHH